MSTWWVGEEQLDSDQQRVIALPRDQSIFVTGPPGSGKTNLLLLRANYLYLSDLPNIVVATFTRPLREFIASGAFRYSFPIEKVMTCLEWQTDLIRQYKSGFSSGGDFQSRRHGTYLALMEAVNEFGLENIYDAILLDEAQDYSIDEIRLFRRLAKNIFCVADGRQQIYESGNVIEEIQSSVDVSVVLKFHYRNGVKICKVADNIANKWPGYELLAETSNYPEASTPSSADINRYQDLEEQISAVCTSLPNQLAAFPDEMIGILAPKHETAEAIWEALQQTPHADSSVLLLSNGQNLTLPPGKQIIVSTCHSSKGLEFRCVHILNAHELKKFENNRRIAFTAITRAKTSVRIYSSDGVHAYIEGAVAAANSNKRTPTVREAFGPST